MRRTQHSDSGHDDARAIAWFRTELEQLATLDSDTIALVLDATRTDHTTVRSIIADCLDEAYEYDTQADEASMSGDDDHAQFCRQESAAWRATVTVLRIADTRQRGEHLAARSRRIA
ncbi:hypothetical protein [Gordonia aichiensis]|uniref:TY-Chap C-terminal domain-containing protein n=1 Tax=Gordonia aichiensis NBRC 108223 TaxID=1220583 RepID=L7KGR8_9ACTN|nr:hypothetical protein [Gordonia aichiensis]GAC47132.1 hypothetical protein GOACH_03_01490 [Gordonia aichiensis NBRC 108223]